MRNNINTELCIELSDILKKNASYNFETKIKRFIKRKSIKKDIAFWPNALVIYALVEANKMESARNILKEWKKSRYHIDNYDDILMAYILLSKTDIMNDGDKTELCNIINNSIKKYTDQPVPYRPSKENEIYIDLLGMLPQYLCWIGNENNQREYIDWALLIFKEFMRKSTDHETGLPYHAYNKKTGEKMGIIGWGRSLGWLMIGLSESIVSLNDRFEEDRNLLIKIYKQYFELIKNYQREDGGFSWCLTSKEGHLDSSVTGMILMSAYIVNNCIKFNKEDLEMLEKMEKCLDGCYADGRVLNCSAECGGVGVYPQKYDSYAWSVAPYSIIKSLKGRNV